MPTPALLAIPYWAMLGPPLAYLLGRNRSAPVRWIAIGAALAVAAELVEQVVTDHRLLVLETPAVFTAYLIALVHWQLSDLERAAFRIAIVALVVVYIGLVTFIPAETPFGHLGSPIYAALLSTGACWTLVRRWRRVPPEHSALRTDSTWILAGLCLFGTVRMISQPLGVALTTFHRFDLFTAVWEIRGACIAVAFVAITIGCALRPLPVDPAR